MPFCTTSTPVGNLNKKSLSTRVTLYFAFLKLIVVICSNASTIFITDNLFSVNPSMTLLKPAPSSLGTASTHLIFWFISLATWSSIFLSVKYFSIFLPAIMRSGVDPATFAIGLIETCLRS